MRSRVKLRPGERSTTSAVVGRGRRVISFVGGGLFPGAGNEAARARSPDREGWSVGSVVSHSAPRREGSVQSIAQELRDVGHDGTDVLLGQLALEGVVDLDLLLVPHQDRDIRILGDLVV